MQKLTLNYTHLQEHTHLLRLRVKVTYLRVNNTHLERLYTYIFIYRIAGNFRGVLIFVIFVTMPRVTKFSTHEFFHPRIFSRY